MNENQSLHEDTDRALHEAGENGNGNENQQSITKGLASEMDGANEDIGSLSAYRAAYLKDHQMLTK